MRLSAPDAGKQPAVPTAQHHHIHVSTTGHAQVPAEPFNASAMHQLGSLQPSLHYQHAHEALDHQLPGSSSMHLLAGTAPHGQRHPSHSRHACGYAQQSSQTVGERAAPAYTPYHIPGLTAQQQAVKDLEDQELAGALRQRQNVYQVGYEIDEFGTLRLPQKAHPRMIPMKHVFAQRWQHQQEAANLSMSQLLAAVGEQNPLPVVGTESILDCHAACMAHPVHDVPGVSAPAANAKLPMTFQLSQAKQAMRKAETGSPKVSCTMSNGTEHSQLQDYKFTSWQMDQLATSSVVNDPFLEQYIDRLNENFDSSYWSMLEHLFAFQ